LALKAGWYSPDDYQNLAEVVHRREIEREQLRKQIEELRSQPHPEPGTLPTLNSEQLKKLEEQALGILKLGKPAPAYKAAQKVLRRFIELTATPTE